MTIPEDRFYTIPLANDLMMLVSVMMPLVGQKDLEIKHLGKRCADNPEQKEITKRWIQKKFDEALTGKVSQEGRADPKFFEIDTARLNEIDFDNLVQFKPEDNG